MTPTHINIKPRQEIQPDVTTPELRCGQKYDNKHAWKDLQAEQEEYIEHLTEQNKKINTIQYIPEIPRNTTDILQMKIKSIIPSTNREESNNVKKLIQYTTYYPTPIPSTENIHHTKPKHTKYQIPTPKDTSCQVQTVS